jgi:lipopolysaccharide/colanic/teichoic acid biosynthesis glycosyltransferase
MPSSVNKIIVPKIENLPKRLVYHAVKRFFDILAAILMLLVLLIPLGIFALLIKSDHGPAIFKQERLGRGGQPFIIYKLRTMRVDAESDGPRWSEKNDPRVTKLGKFLRRWQIDEWPQLFNILKGEMSFVGPRPEVKALHEEFCRYVDGFDQRLLVTPGLTGWAQVNGGADLKPEEKIMFDVAYIQKQSLWFDLRCIFKTILLVFNQKGY